MNGSSSETLAEAPWPVAARKLLTAREQALYQRLLSLYPKHQVFVQVALSQLVDVDRNYPESESIRARYKQLVADFVLCRADLSIVAVIELDDRSHRQRARQDADARKTKALVDAGLRLVRIPAGALPSEEELREIIDADRREAGGDRTDTHKMHRFDVPEPELRLADDWVAPAPDSPGEYREGAVQRALRAGALRIVLIGLAVAGGWLAYTQLLPVALKHVFQPPAVPHAPMLAGRAQPDLAEKTRAEGEAAAAQRQKEHAWLAYYSAPASCEHPVDWKAQVECGNLYMRAKKDFEKRWLEHGSVGGVRK